jgi:hypothetical protein
MRYLAAILFALMLAITAISVELFRYQGAAKDGGLAGSLLNLARREVGSERGGFGLTYFW